MKWAETRFSHCGKGCVLPTMSDGPRKVFPNPCTYVYGRSEGELDQEKQNRMSEFLSIV